MFTRIGYSTTVLRECLGLYGRILLGRERLDLPRFSSDAYDLSLGMFGPVTLIAAVVGLLLGQQTDSLLARVDLPAVAVQMVGNAVVLEFAPLLIGILVAARGGVALAVRIASMVSRKEIDGLILSGVNPVHYTVGATLLAVLLASFALGVWAQLVMLSGVGLWLDLAGSLPAPLFLDSLARSLEAADLLQAVAKTLLFALLVTLVAAREGGNVERRPQGIAQAATRTMLQAIAVILVTDLLFAVL